MQDDEESPAEVKSGAKHGKKYAHDQAQANQEDDEEEEEDYDDE